MSYITRIASVKFDGVGAELARENFRSGKERFVVYFIDGDFEYTEGIFKTEPEAKTCYDKLVRDMDEGWRP